MVAPPRPSGLLTGRPAGKGRQGWRRPSGSQVRLEERQGPLPCQLGVRGVIAGAGPVGERVLGFVTVVLSMQAITVIIRCIGE